MKRIAFSALGLLASTAAHAYTVSIDSALPTNFDLFNDYVGDTGTFTTPMGTFSGDGTVYASGDSGPDHAQPAGTDTAYMAVPSGETLTLNEAVTSFSLIWGSADGNPDGVTNTLTLGSFVIPGIAIASLIDGFNGGTGWITISGVPAFSTVTFNSTSPAFEFTLDPPSIGSIPEPSTWAMMLLGFAGLGYAASQRRRVAAV